MDRALKNQSGFSVVEILIALLIFSAAALAIMSFSRNTIIMSSNTRGRDAAFLSAEKKISELSVQPFPAAQGNDVDVLDNITYSRFWTVTDTAYIKRAIVTVTFPSVKGIFRHVVLAGAIN
jgi:prepilin-type N-terminal cleavage/methylation domain-containing protein